MKAFIGRKKELSLFMDTFTSNRSEFRIVRGRRRVGKTYLLRESIRGRDDVVFFSGLEDVTSDRAIRDRFTLTVATFSKNDILASSKNLSWPVLFNTVFEIAQKRKHLIVIFDEIQWIARHGSGFLSDLKEAWTTKFQLSEKIKIIICGSSAKFFQAKTGNVESVLYKMRTMSDIWVLPMTLSETCLFCPGWNKHEIVLTQMMFGGVPYYLDLIKESERGFMQCINEMAFSANTIFFDEVHETLKFDFSSLPRVIEILSVIGLTGKTMNQILETSLIPSSTVDELLEKLVDYQILYKQGPFGEKLKAKDIGVRYYIHDEFLNFYFTVLIKEKMRIQNNTKNIMIFNRILADGYYIKEYTGYAFELLMRKIIERNVRTTLTELLSIHNLSQYEVGSYWGKGFSQIDLIVDSNEDRCTRILEVKWKNNKIGIHDENIFQDLINKNFPNHRKHTLRRFLIASSGFTEEAYALAKEKNIVLVTLDDLFDGPSVKENPVC